MWTHFLLWHLIWLTWKQQAAVDSHRCHLLTEQGNRNKKERRQWPSRRGKGETTGMLKKTGGWRELLHKTGNSWEGSHKKRRKHTQRRNLHLFCGFRGTTTLCLSHKHVIFSNNANVVGLIHCLTFSCCHSTNLKHMKFSGLLCSLSRYFSILLKELNQTGF